MIYQYLCDKCNIAWEVHRKVDERDNPLPCAECGGGTRRPITGVPIIFNDSGFPSNDMRAAYKGGPTIGRKLSFKEQEMVARMYPDAVDGKGLTKEDVL